MLHMLLRGRHARRRHLPPLPRVPAPAAVGVVAIVATAVGALAVPALSAPPDGPAPAVAAAALTNERGAPSADDAATLLRERQSAGRTASRSLARDEHVPRARDSRRAEIRAAYVASRLERIRERRAEIVRERRIAAARERRIAAARAARERRVAAARAAAAEREAAKGLLRPVPGGVASPYGMRTHPVTGAYKMHDGTDFEAGCGTPIKAAASGSVVQAEELSGYGLQVVLDNGRVSGRPLRTSYSHLSRFAVSAGDAVTRGETIGYVGTTGLSTGCHLHFMVFSGEEPADPMDWLAR